MTSFNDNDGVTVYRERFYFEEMCSVASGDSMESVVTELGFGQPK